MMSYWLALVAGCQGCPLSTWVVEHGMVPLLVPEVFPPVDFSMQAHVFFGDTWHHPYISICFCGKHLMYRKCTGFGCLYVLSQHALVFKFASSAAYPKNYQCRKHQITSSVCMTSGGLYLELRLCSMRNPEINIETLDFFLLSCCRSCIPHLKLKNFIPTVLTLSK